MTPAPSELTDRAALSRNRARARRTAGTAMFLQRLALDEINQRLSVVNKAFRLPAVVTPFRDLWSSGFASADFYEDQNNLALPAQKYDLVIHAMALHWANDPLGQIIQCARALRPDGLFMACLFGGETLVELRTALAQAETAIRGGLSPRIAPMGELRDLGGLLQRAGLALPVADTVRQKVTFGSARHLMHDLRAMGEANALATRHRGPLSRSVLDRTEQIYSEHFAEPDGRLYATFEIVFLSGWAPHPDQPVALRPGSATHSLAGALERAKSDKDD